MGKVSGTRTFVKKVNTTFETFFIFMIMAIQKIGLSMVSEFVVRV